MISATVNLALVNSELVKENILLSAANLNLRLKNRDMMDRIVFLGAALEAAMSIVTFTETGAFIYLGTSRGYYRWGKEDHNGGVLFRVRDMMRSEFPMGYELSSM